MSSPPQAQGPALAIQRFLARCEDRRGALLPLLHQLQREYGFVADETVPLVAEALNLSRAEVHGVLSFYSDFRRAPAGRHVLKLCRAEACQARGGRQIEQLAVDRLGVEFGRTRADGQLSLDSVYCLGLCPIGPAALLDGRPIAGIDEARLGEIAQEITS